MIIRQYQCFKSMFCSFFSFFIVEIQASLYPPPGGKFHYFFNPSLSAQSEKKCYVLCVNGVCVCVYVLYCHFKSQYLQMKAIWDHNNMQL